MRTALGVYLNENHETKQNMDVVAYPSGQIQQNM